MKRMKPYDVPHKGLRNALSQFSLLAGKTDYANASEIELLYNLGIKAFNILTIHAEDENDITLAELESRCPGASKQDVDDHLQLHAAQGILEKILLDIYLKSKTGNDAADDGAAFYIELGIFHGIYLAHTAEEERVTQPLLWQYFTDDELASFRRRIMKKNPPDTLLTWFQFIIPAQSHDENTALLSGFKKMAPPDFFNQAMKIIEGVLSNQEFNKLRTALEI